MNRRWAVFFGVGFLIVLAFNVFGTINDIRHDRYIRETVQRDKAQEKCIVDLAAWQQDWLIWRWEQNPDATTPEVLEYRRTHPQPLCDFHQVT